MRILPYFFIPRATIGGQLKSNYYNNKNTSQTSNAIYAQTLVLPSMDIHSQSLKTLSKKLPLPISNNFYCEKDIF